jgi:cytoskeletal protein CcmA (bactofilin family)
MFNHDQGAGRGNSETIIARGVKVEGDFASDGNVIIEGEVNGSVKAAGHLTVGSSAKIKADVSAGEAVVSGELTGNLSVVGRLDLQESSVIVGDLIADVLIVAAGAKINGRITMSGKAGE